MADQLGLWWKSLVLFSVLLKLFLLRTYRSTDFEVHRNWLAVTHSLPLAKWYYEDTSQWTLDYPPLFAWFEFTLSQIAVLVDPQMVMINNLECSSMATVLFQRLSVVFTDLMLAYASIEYCSFVSRGKKVSRFLGQQNLILAVLLVFNCGLILVDHIHFQYNGFLFGMLLLSITRISQGKILEGSFWFAVLLNFKHLFLYIAPAYFIFLLRNYCFRSAISPQKGKQLMVMGVNLWDFSPLRLFRLGFVVVSVFGVSFGPFIAMGQFQQLLSRLFPFKRGLCHAYWAPNFWALYNTLDKVAVVAGPKLKLFTFNATLKQASMTGGLVGESEHLVLASIPPAVTMALTLVSIMPAVLHTWFRPSGVKGFLRCLILCSFGSFLFGWHVHEKAVLMIIIPLSLLATVNRCNARVFLILSTTGHFSLFPLLFHPQETPIKVCLMLMFTIVSFYSLCLIHCGESSTKEKSFMDLFKLPLIRWYEALYLYGLVILHIYCTMLHPLTGLARRYPFLPLMMTSVYCALGVMWSWVLFYYHTFYDVDISPGKKNN